MARPRKRWKQQTIEYRRRAGRHGGRRKNAGRKRGRRVQHVTRRELDGRTPVHVTLRVLPEVGRLRRRHQYTALRAALARATVRDGFRVCHYSIQGNHVHLVVEPDSRDALSRGMISLKVTAARRLNNLANRHGRVFADRYHARYLTSPAQVRRALCYVLLNWRRHGEHHDHKTWPVDPFSSADAFDGWDGYVPSPPLWLRRGEPPPVVPAERWLLTTGWRRHGALRPRETPGPRS